MTKYFRKVLLVILLMNFYSGLPLVLTAATLTAWLADMQVDRALIGLFAAVGTPYAFKFLWAPLVDGMRLPLLHRLGRRRSWLLLTQALLAMALVVMGANNPAVTPGLTALIAVAIATFSATQDIAVDAYRVERLTENEQGLGATMAIFGYRIGMLISGAGALWLADRIGWHGTYIAMAALMASAMALTLMAKEPAAEAETRPAPEQALPARVGAFFRDSVIAPFADFMTRPHWLMVLLFVILYKLGDAFMGAMFNPFLLDLGFTKSDIAAVVKLYGLAATLLGSFAGGFVVARIGIFRTLLLGGFLHMLTNFMLVELALRGTDHGFLILSISLENFTAGITGVAFIAYLSALTKTHYTATQYALLSSLAAFGRTWLSTPSGAVADALGWATFFALSSAMAIPGMLLLWWLETRRVRAKESAS